MEVDELYYKYNKELRNLIILVEVRLNIFPIGILNEVRDFNDHLSRIYLEDESVDKNVELKLSKRHLNRARLDCYKSLLINGEDQHKNFVKNYRYTNLGEVDSGKFYPEYNRKLKEARDKAGEAKLSEGKGNSHLEKTAEIFHEAFALYEDLDNFVKENYENLAWSSCFQKKKFWATNVTAFIVSVVAGLIVGILLKLIFLV